ncbi:MAG: FkbM family methyltransferase [Planctomycetaceae bacterium]|nr:FkbM family methyltransferase [Planctomycetaceae bacterium]
MLDWLRYQYRKLTRPRVITNGGVRIDLGPVAGTRYARSFYRDTHERDERDIVGKHLTSTDTVLELGAGMGIVTILCCQRIGSSRVHTFEANQRLEAALRRNFELNGVSPRLDLRMVSLAAGPQEFFVSDRFVLSSRHSTASGAGSHRTTIESVPIADVLADVRPTFLIADIEGGEVDLADAGIDLQGVRKICLEMHPHIIGDDGVSRVVAALVQQGFSLCLNESRGNVMYFERPASNCGNGRAAA